MRAVAITGLGAVSALGHGAPALWEAIAAGRDGIRPLARFSTADFKVHTAALVPGRDGPGSAEDSPWKGGLAVEFAVAAAREALASRGAGAPLVAPHRIAVILGTSLGQRSTGLHTLAEEVAEAVGARGPRLTLSTACTSSTTALGLGRDLLWDGCVDLALVGGTDSVTPDMFAGFHALGLLTPGKCAPFSQPFGTTLGEGAGLLVLERLAECGGRARAVLRGYALSCDAFHATSPEPSGAGVARALVNALADAGAEAAEVDYVNAHGTGTTTNDPAEWRAVQTALGPRALEIPLSSSKSFLGHAQGAAGALETIVTLLGMEKGAVPPTLNFQGARPRCPLDPVADPVPRPARVRAALCTNSAFGGANTALLLARAPEQLAQATPAPPPQASLGPPPQAAPAPAPQAAPPPASFGSPARPVYVLGASAVGPFGAGLPSLLAALDAGGRLDGRARFDGLGRHAPELDPKGLDRSGELLTAAVAAALAGSGCVPRGAARVRTGLFVGAQRISPQTVAEHDASVRERGLARLSSAAFTRLVLNAAAGACARLLALQGPGSTLTAHRGAGLHALAWAAHALATRADADVLVAAGVDELAPDDDPAAICEGAAALVLSHQPRPGAQRLAGWAFAGPGRADEAVASALARAGRAREEVVRLDAPEALLGLARATGPLLACAAAVGRLAAGSPGPWLIVEPGGDSAACAVVLEPA